MGVLYNPESSQWAGEIRGREKERDESDKRKEGKMETATAMEKNLKDT